MNTYQAIMSAASHIERNPSDFDFFQIVTPNHCGTPACALGWIGFYLGERGDHRACLPSLGFTADADGAFDFYARMCDLAGEVNWRKDAAIVSRILRLYAEKYHGHEKPFERPTSAMVSDLMRSVMGARIPEGMLESPEYGQ